MDFSEDTSIVDALRTVRDENKKVEIVLKSGKTFGGAVHTVGKQCVVLELSGPRSFFNAVIGIEEIAALEIQVKTA